MERDRVHWSVKEQGGWRVPCFNEDWGPMPCTFHPDDEEVARWVASNHGVEATWVEPASEPTS